MGLDYVVVSGKRDIHNTLWLIGFEVNTPDILLKQQMGLICIFNSKGIIYKVDKLG